MSQFYRWRKDIIRECWRNRNIGRRVRSGTWNGGGKSSKRNKGIRLGFMALMSSGMRSPSRITNTTLWIISTLTIITTNTTITTKITTDTTITTKLTTVHNYHTK
jgi:hypothetical protein